MGSGKSILGKLLASRLSLPLLDIDDLITQKACKDIPTIFTEDGEAFFRRLESEVLAEVLNVHKSSVVATGGGAVLAEENRKLLKQHAKVIWLDASPEVLAARIAGDSNRPLLRDVDALTRMQDLAIQRNPLYAEIADFHFNTEEKTDEESLNALLRFLSVE